MKPSEKDVFVFKDIAEFRFIIFELLCRRHFPRKTREATATWLKRRCADKWLRGSSFDERRRLYQLTPKAGKYLRDNESFHVPRSSIRPVKPLTKATRYAALLYCTRSKGENLSLYAPSRNLDKFPDLAAHIEAGKLDPFRQKLFYADGEILGLFLLDRGQRSFYGRKARPLLQSLFGRRKRIGNQFVIDPALPGWDSMRLRLQHGVFRLTIATVTDARRKELTEEIKSSRPPFTWEVVVLPDVANVLPRQRVLVPRQTLLIEKETQE